MFLFKKFTKKILGNSFHVDQKLLKSNTLTNEMKKQWDEPLLPEENLIEKDVIWTGIINGIKEKANKHILLSARKYRIAKTYAAAATVLLLISASVTGYMYLHPKKGNLAYIVHSGNQQTELITLADGSRIRLGAGSTLTYPDEFAGKERVVTLEGQAFFDVTPNKEKPFIIRMDKVAVTVLGTSFEVFNDKNNDTFETILLSGEVRVDYEDHLLNKKESHFLFPNQLIRMSLKDGESYINQVDANLYSEWRNYNGLRFNNEKLAIIIPRLERWFGTKIICKNQSSLKQMFTFKVTDEPLEQIVALMSKTTPVSCEKNDGYYILY